MPWLMRVSPCVRTTSLDDQVASHTSFGECSADFRTPLRIIYDHEVIMYRNCSCAVEFEDGEVACLPGSFLIIPPGKWHSEVCLESYGGCRYWCHFDWQFQAVRPNSPIMTFATHKPRYELCRPAPDFVPLERLHGLIPRPKKAYRLAERLAGLMRAGTPHDRMIAGAVLHELLIELLDVSPAGDGKACGGEGRDIPLASRMRRALDLAASKSGERLKLCNLLSVFGHSYEHLCRVFTASYGVSPVRYIQAQRMTNAKVLLRGSRLTVAEVCYQVGMNSPAYFTKTFRSLTGRTPSEFRKAWEGEG